MKKIVFSTAIIVFITLNSFTQIENEIIDHLCRYRILNSSGQVIGTVQFTAPDNVSCSSKVAKDHALAMFEVWGSNW